MNVYEKNCGAAASMARGMSGDPRSSGTAIRKDSVQDALEALTKDIHALHEEIGQLAQRLGPVMNSCPEAPSQAGALAPVPVAPPLRAQLRDAREHVTTMRSRVRGLLDGLDL